MQKIERYALDVTGVVQGVGFRPYIYNLALKHKLSGWVLNSGEGVSLEIEGSSDDCKAFLAEVKLLAPELARIDNITINQINVLFESDFVILPSRNGHKTTLIPPDMGICHDCLADLFNKTNRRYRYPFTNCTNCGPRFTIVKDLPYDRHNTAMAKFPLCPDCEREFVTPLDRRFQDQPNCCPNCGPRLIYREEGKVACGDPITQAKFAIRAGKIIAVKGIGGYHLVCDALNENAVAELRRRKLRQNKPFAVMMDSINTVKQYCDCTDYEERLLTSQRRPIVLLAKKNGTRQVASQVAPGNQRLGVMLPYTPLHYLLTEDTKVLVMTSANYSDEPIIYNDQEQEKLTALVDAILDHDREILHRCDDSVLACPVEGQHIFIRRSRGFVPEPLTIADCQSNILALGAQQKNTFCLTRGNEAFISQHIGDLDDLSAYLGYQQEIDFFVNLFDCSPDYLAHDIHPQYLSTKYAREFPQKLPLIAVQHHHAHLASVLAEHNHQNLAIGLIYDGTGYGEDGNLWGGEILLGDRCGYQRVAHLLEAPLPGGEQAIKEPWRAAAGYLSLSYAGDDISQIAPTGLLTDSWPLVRQAMRAGFNTPLTSAMGRLFDAVAALLDLGRKVDYDGQAAVALEQVAAKEEEFAYEMPIINRTNEYILDWRQTIRDIISDLNCSTAIDIIAARFHNTIVKTSVDICCRLRDERNINTVALSGGCWQNFILLTRAQQQLHEAGFNVLVNSAVPINDGGIAYGQAAVAAAKINKGAL